MVDQSRRLFLKSASLGAAVVGVAAAFPALQASAASAADERSGPAHDGPLMAYVSDRRRGEVTVMVGEREVVRHDPDLAARLARLASSARWGAE